MTHSVPRIAWRKLLVEAVVLVVSVYVAIFLEGMSDQRTRHREAVQALRMLRAELELDRRNLDVILTAQRDRDVRHRRIDLWLNDIAGAPTDSLVTDVRALLSVNRTMFPRSASWATMVASGQLTDLGDPNLVSHLADFYENRNARLVYNGEVYDTWVSELARGAVPEVWDQSRGRFLTGDPTAISRLRGRLTGVHDFGLGFIGLLDEWGVSLDSLATDVDAFLAQEGGGV
jgi:hypothetical protein